MARYIDAKHLYDRVKTETNPYGKPTLDYESGLKVLRMIEQEPTVNIAPKVGKWVSVEGDVIFKCSNCEAEISTSWDYENDYMFTFCPCCGAMMNGGAE